MAYFKFYVLSCAQRTFG